MLENNSQQFLEVCKTGHLCEILIGIRI